MTEYTPDTEQVREQYTREQPPHIGTVSQKGSEFERWLEQIKREAKAEALEEAASNSQMGPVAHGWNASGIASWLRARAAQHRKGSS